MCAAEYMCVGACCNAHGTWCGRRVVCVGKAACCNVI